MKNYSKYLGFLYHVDQASSLSEDLNRIDAQELKNIVSIEAYQALINSLEKLSEKFLTYRSVRRRPEDSFEEYSLSKIIKKLNYLLMHSSSDQGASEIEWLLRIVLMSSKVFANTKELDTYLSNLTGFTHSTKSTGRDRIVDWYFRQLQNYPVELRDHITRRIAQHLFINLPSGYGDWSAILNSKDQ